MIVDTSVLIALLTREPGVEALIEKLGAASVRRMSAASFGEAILVLRARLGRNPEPLLRAEVDALGIEIVDFRQSQLTWFAYAADRYGKGRHSAALNFGDCFSYALAKSTDLPLLFVGNDFSQTDIKAA